MTLLPQVFGKDFDKLFVGFDDHWSRMLQLNDEMTKNIPNYPPYNIYKADENKYVIELAVAGFAKSDIEVTLEGNKLVIKGSAKEDELKEEENFLFKGIANRNFTRSFTLADKIEIGQAEMVNGMLKVWLENLVQAQDTIKKIAIKEKSE